MKIILRLEFLLVLILSIVFLTLSTLNVQAQNLLSDNPRNLPAGQLPQILKDKAPGDSPSLVLPVVPSPEKKTDEPQIPRILIREIKINGGTAFSEKELREIATPYLNQVLTNELLEEIRHTLTVLYINKGYVNSGAIIPDQKVVDGKLIFNIIEGRVTDITVKGNKWFYPEYLKSRLFLDAGPPLNIDDMQKRLFLLQQDPRIASIQAELKPGVTLGDGQMNVDVEENSPYQLQLGFDNYQPPTVGSKRGIISGTHQNLIGIGDTLNLTGIVSEDNDTQMDFMYSLPITTHDTSIMVRYSNDALNVTEGVFEELDIESESETYQVILRHPFYRTLSQEFSMALIGEHNINKTYLLGQPYSFSAGAVNGESINTVLRFAQDWSYRSQHQVISARSQFSYGLNEMNATIHSSDLPDGRFFTWLGQFQWARILDFLDTQFIFRTDVQLSNDSLMGLEQMAVGGRYTVRGYRENQLVRDQAIISSLEARIPLIRDKDWADYLQLAAFYDFGKAWQKHVDTPSPRNISSVGLGLRWSGFVIKTPFKIKPSFEFYWGHALRNVDTPGGDLQDDGIHFHFGIQIY